MRWGDAAPPGRHPERDAGIGSGAGGGSALLVQRRWLQEQGAHKTTATRGMKKTRLLKTQGLATICAHLLSNTDPGSSCLQQSKPELKKLWGNQNLPRNTGLISMKFRSFPVFKGKHYTEVVCIFQFGDVLLNVVGWYFLNTCF